MDDIVEQLRDEQGKYMTDLVTERRLAATEIERLRKALRCVANDIRTPRSWLISRLVFIGVGLWFLFMILDVSGVI